MKITIDENVAIPRQFGIRGVQTQILFKNRDVVATKIEALSKAQLTAFIKKHIYYDYDLPIRLKYYRKPTLISGTIE